MFVHTLECRVRAGVRDPQKAQGFLKTAVEYGLIAPDAAKRLTLVPVDLTDPDSIPPAIGNAGKGMHQPCELPLQCSCSSGRCPTSADRDALFIIPSVSWRNVP